MYCVSVGTITFKSYLESTEYSSTEAKQKLVDVSERINIKLIQQIAMLSECACAEYERNQF